MSFDLFTDELPAVSPVARPKGDSQEEQLQKYNFHRQANGTLQYYIDRTEYLSAYVLAFSFFEDRMKALAVVFYRDYSQKTDYEKSINIDMSRLIGNLYKDNEKLAKIIDTHGNEITSTFVENLNKLLHQRNKLIHEAMWRPNAIKLKDIEILLEAKQIIYSHQRRLMRYIRNSHTHQPI